MNKKDRICDFHTSKIFASAKPPPFRVCQEKCVSFFVSFFTSVNLFCYLQIYHHHF